MNDKDFCVKLLTIAKELNDMAENVADNDEQYNICIYITDKIINEYEIYKKLHNL